MVQQGPPTVTPEPPRTAKLWAEPSVIRPANAADGQQSETAMQTNAAIPVVRGFRTSPNERPLRAILLKTSGTLRGTYVATARTAHIG